MAKPVWPLVESYLCDCIFTLLPTGHTPVFQKQPVHLGAQLSTLLSRMQTFWHLRIDSLLLLLLVLYCKKHNLCSCSRDQPKIFFFLSFCVIKPFSREGPKHSFSLHAFGKLGRTWPLPSLLHKVHLEFMSRLRSQDVS